MIRRNIEMEEIKVSVIMPVYNAAAYIEKTIQSIIGQTEKNIEIIAVNDGSSDETSDILRRLQQKDSRIKVLDLEHRNAGYARNQGILAAKGDYLYFFDADDSCSENLLKNTYRKAKKESADIVAFGYKRVYPDGSEKIYHALNIPMDKEVFSWRDCSDSVLTAINPTPWNKLFRREFIMDNQLQFEEISSTNDITFCSVSLAFAERITWIDEPYYFYNISVSNSITSKKKKNKQNILTAVTSVLRQVRSLPYYEEIKKSAVLFAVDNLSYAFIHYCTDFNDEDTMSFYKTVHEMFSSEEFSAVQNEDMDSWFYRWLQVFRKYCFEDLYTLMGNKKIIVSLTTYPARIDIINKVLQTIYRQSKTPDEIILWLADSQFPGLEKDLPENLRNLIDSGQLTLRWCQDIRPHKKYLFAMKEYPDDLIITIDDDLYYEPIMIENLYLSYLEYPRCVSACRTHLIAMDEKGNFLPYSDWIKETNLVLNEPCMELFATGGAGTLYPPHLFDEKFLDPDLVQKLCPIADDLWLKTMQILADIPVVQAYPFDNLWYVEDSQEEGLVHTNVERNMNDVQFEQIRKWADEQYGERCLERGIINSANSQVPYGMYRLSLKFRPLMEENKRLRDEYNKLRFDFDNVVNSVSFKTGRAITSLPRNIRDLFKRK